MKLEVLGHVLATDGLKTAQSKVKSITLWEKPKIINE